VQYFTNGFDTRTKGVDLVATHAFQIANGRLSTQLAYSYNSSSVPTYDVTVICGGQPGPKNSICLPGHTPAAIVNIQHYAPNHRANLSLDYRWNQFEAVVHENYYGKYQDEYDYPGQIFSEKYTTDLDLAYEAFRGITFGIGGRNIFNAYPDKIANSSTNKVYPSTGGLLDGEVYPRTGGPFGYNGAFWYARVAAKF